jgi:hypothetical protein
MIGSRSRFDARPSPSPAIMDKFDKHLVRRQNGTNGRPS